ncbi:MAG: ATP-dependent helicase [Bdellovibrionota bacterium]
MLEQLNDRQKQAVTTINGALLVLAGAGTGKTKVITARIAWMISQGIEPENIVAVSFTNKAANEMRERLSHLIGDRKAKRVFLSTFHSFALKILREYNVEVGLQKNFSIADENESISLLKESIRELALEDIISITSAVEKMSYYKDNLYEEKDFKKSTNFFDAKFCCKLFLAYNRRLRLFNLVDFDDIVYLATMGFLNNESLLNKMRENYKYLLVDEYQDTSFSQFKFIQLLAQPRGNVCVVGDDDQSIYSWRGARPSIIADFLKEFPLAKRVTLDQNYRCSSNILNAANCVIRENTERLGKELWSQKINEHPVTIQSCENEREEAEFIVEKINLFRDKNSQFNYSNIAILYRSSSLTIPIEQIFQEKNIPYVLHGGTKFFDKKEIRDLFSYIKFANNNKDLNSLFRIINLPARGIGIATLEKIKARFIKQQDLFEILSELSYENSSISSFLELWNIYGQALKNSKGIPNIIEAIKDCYENIGLKKDILLNSSNMQVAQYRLDTIERVFKVIEKIGLPNASLQDITDALHLDEAQFAPKLEADGKVQLMTIHASKGLEFPIVFLVGVEEGILPHERSLNIANGEQEERRLFYVAMTRAKDKLLLSHCVTRKRSRSQSEEQKPSRFLSAIPAGVAEFTRVDPMIEVERKNDALKKLFNLFK